MCEAFETDRGHLLCSFSIWNERSSDGFFSSFGYDSSRAVRTPRCALPDASGESDGYPMRSINPSIPSTSLTRFPRISSQSPQRPDSQIGLIVGRAVHRHLQLIEHGVFKVRFYLRSFHSTLIIYPLSCLTIFISGNF